LPRFGAALAKQHADWISIRPMPGPDALAVNGDAAKGYLGATWDYQTAVLERKWWANTLVNDG
jgi:hypothetical protein